MYLRFSKHSISTWFLNGSGTVLERLHRICTHFKILKKSSNQRNSLKSNVCLLFHASSLYSSENWDFPRTDFGAQLFSDDSRNLDVKNASRKFMNPSTYSSWANFRKRHWSRPNLCNHYPLKIIFQGKCTCTLIWRDKSGEILAFWKRGSN